MLDLATMFPHAKGYATQANAERKLAHARHEFPFTRSLGVTVQRPDGRWLPIVVVCSTDSWMTMGLCSRGVCVTNC